MRKLTGYIGAMIIVFALMGSILAGYALNINGTSTVMNEYEKVTDVSGLYTHSQEPTYIDYNPASNYIGYALSENYDNPTVNCYPYKLVKNNTITIDPVNRLVSIQNVSNNVIAHSGYYFVCDYFYCFNSGAGYGYIYTYTRGLESTTGTITITTDGSSNLSLNYNGVTLNYTGVKYPVAYTTMALADHWLKAREQTYLYLNTGGGLLSIFTNSNWGSNAPGIAISNTAYNLANNTFVNVDAVTNLGNVANGVNRYSAGYNTNIGVIIYPKTVYSNSIDLGINYVESNRVNNYPIINSNATMTTQVTTLTVGNLSATDYWPDVPSGWNKTGYLIWETQPIYPHDTITAPYFYTTINLNDYNYGNTMLHQYKLTDILANYTIPTGTQTLKITTNSSDIRTYQYYNLDANVISFVNASDNGFIQSFNDIANKKDYLIYDVGNNICTVYDYNGVSLYSNAPENIGVIFCDNTGAKYMRYSHFETVNDITSGYFDMDNRPVPFITITANIYNPADIDYIDITKGYTIKNTNVNNTVWNNEYTNGKIQLLFRAETTGLNYHNDVVIGDNSISIDYTGTRFNITLNGGDPVDIGTWRNIILDIDLVNGKLAAIPVRTFNSFTNVVMDNTNIFIGDLVNATPTNIIEWAPTPNSLLFNVYSTSVFMDTYGVVMVDPTLNVTNYFTTLDNFYQLRLSNFSMYGQTMTVNGVTGIVTGDKITFNDETVQLKEMAITYADGNVTISDSYGNIDLGAIVDNTVSMTGAWYFISDLYSGYTTQKVIYDWDWGQFILDDKAFGVIYIGLCIIGLIVARHFCTLTITDYLLFVVSIAIALTVPVIA